MKVIDLFSGCGGLSYGFIKDGFQIKRAVEFDASIANIGTNGEIGFTVTPWNQIAFSGNNADSIESFRALLNNNPATVIYQLATPQIIDITNTPTGQAYKSLQTYYQYTHIYSTTQDGAKPVITAEIKQF